MSKDKESNHLKTKAFKLTRCEEMGNALNLALDPIFDQVYEYVGWGGSFLYDLYRCINDFGVLMDFYLANKQTYFSGNAYCGEIVEGNLIRFKDYEESFIHEMDFNDFIRINNQFHDLDSKRSDEIWFKIINNKILVEGIWLNKNTDHK